MIIWNLYLQSRCESWPVVNTCINSERGDVHEIDAERVVERCITETLEIPQRDRWSGWGLSEWWLKVSITHLQSSYPLGPQEALVYASLPRSSSLP